MTSAETCSQACGMAIRSSRYSTVAPKPTAFVIDDSGYIQAFPPSLSRAEWGQQINSNDMLTLDSKRATSLYVVQTLETSMNEKKRAAISIDVPLELRETFFAVAAANDMTGAQLVRAFMRDYIQKNSQGDIFKPAKKAA